MTRVLEIKCVQKADLANFCDFVMFLAWTLGQPGPEENMLGAAPLFKGAILVDAKVGLRAPQLMSISLRVLETHISFGFRCEFQSFTARWFILIAPPG